MTVLPTSLLTAPDEQRFHDDTTRAAMLRRVGKALNDLSAITTVDQLVLRAPVALCDVGFDRAMISRVLDSDWMVESLHSRTDPSEGPRITEAFRAEHTRLGPNVIELEMVRRRVSLLVPDVDREPRVHRDFALALGVSSYVAAPIAPESEVVGFLHADRLHGPMTTFDREVISLFAQEFGALVAAAWMRERFDRLRTTVTRLQSSLGGMVDGCLEGPVCLVTPPQPESSAGATNTVALPGINQHDLVGAPEIDRLLSEREREVLRLMALGETNGRIASRLVITEGTVKSHVRHILRKLNAANRAEAVCRWLQRPGRAM